MGEGGEGEREREGRGWRGGEGRRGDTLVITFKGGIGGDVGGTTRPSNLKVSRAPLHDDLPPPLEAHDEPQQPGGANGAEQREDSPVWKQGCSATAGSLGSSSSAIDRASKGCPKRWSASANQPLEPLWPAISLDMRTIVLAPLVLRSKLSTPPPSTSEMAGPWLGPAGASSPAVRAPSVSTRMTV